jgi:nucleotide-binding universal stress UspA family protein
LPEEILAAIRHPGGQPMTILFPVSLDPSRDDSIGLAIETARSLSAGIRILYVVDRDGIRRMEAGAPPGAIHMAMEAEEEIVRRESSAGSEIVAGLAKRCTDAGVPFTADVREGTPGDEFDKAAARCDLLVAGIESQFFFRRQDAPGKQVLAMLKAKVIPILLAASPHRPVRTVVVGCGGAIRTARATGAMARMGLWKENCRIILLAVDESPEGGEARLAEPRRILQEAAYPPWEEKVIPGPKAKTFPEFCTEVHADAVVLGGWGRHHWDEILGHSITTTLLSDPSRHLFLYM